MFSSIHKETTHMLRLARVFMGLPRYYKGKFMYIFATCVFSTQETHSLHLQAHSTPEVHDKICEIK